MGIRKMNLKTEDGRLLIVKSKTKKAIDRLWGRDISGIEITLHFIVMKLLHHNTIVAFIDILVNILEGLDRNTAFDIDMAIKVLQKKSIVWHDMLICNRRSIGWVDRGDVTTTIGHK
jgi:hypothetical protein